MWLPFRFLEPSRALESSVWMSIVLLLGNRNEYGCFGILG